MTHHNIQRRDFMVAGAATALSTLLPSPRAIAQQLSPKPKIRKSMMFGMVPMMPTLDERLKLAHDAGFEGIEADTMPDPKDVEEMKIGAEKYGLTVEAIVCNKHWSHPLSDPDPAKAQVCVDAMKTSLKNARDLGAGAVLLVPAVVTPAVRYDDAWKRSSERIRELIPVAEETKVVIAVEDVWNKFLLSPLEMKHYIEDFKSPWVQAWFDVGNIHLYGYPQDWIRTLGKLIRRVHIKDFSQKTMQFTNLLEGTIDWPEVGKAFKEIGYEGWFGAEVTGGYLPALTEVAQRLDKIIAHTA